MGSCKNCGCNEVNVSSGCSNCGTPFYSSCSSCPEDHTQLLVEESISPSITVKNSFNIPDCGEEAVLQVPGLKRIGINSRIWASGFGFLTVVAFDQQTGQITVRNDCISCNADVGTQVPACTIYTVDAPDCQTESGQPQSIFPYQVSDFVIPVVAACVTIEVTTVNGLSVGKYVAIAGNSYLLDSIPDADHIVICNKGQGGTPGTTVFAKDEAGNLIHPVVQIDANACTNTPVNSGKVLVCKDDITQPVEGTATGQVLVYDNTTKEWVPSNLLIPVGDCTVLTACFTVDPANPPNFSYLITVGDTSIFTDGQIITIGGTPATIDSIDSGTQMHIIFEEDPVAVFTYEEGTPVCEADCCTQLRDDVFTILDDPCALGDRLDTHGGTAFDDEAGVVDPEGTLLVTESVTGALSEVTVQNPVGCRDMIVMVTLTFLWRTRGVGDDGENVLAGYAPQANADVAAIGSANAAAPADLLAAPFPYVRHGFDFTTANPETIHDQVFTHTLHFTLTQGLEVNIKAAARLEFISGTGDSIKYQALASRIAHIEITT